MSTQWATLYKYVPLNYISDILDNHRLYLNNGENFNDPFEITIVDRKNKSLQHIKGLHILSLTNSHINKLIWSHYTDSHKGVCLTVKVPKSLVYPICYSSKRVYEDSNIDDLVKCCVIKSKKNVKKEISSLSRNKKIALIKDKKWIYEREYRIVFDKEDERGLIYDNGKWYMSVKITTIHLGANFSKNDNATKKSIIDACKRNNVEIKQMVLSNSNYSLRVKKFDEKSIAQKIL